MRRGYNTPDGRPKRPREEARPFTVADWDATLDTYYRKAGWYQRQLNAYRQQNNQEMIAKYESKMTQQHKNLMSASEQFHRLKNALEQQRMFEQADRDTARGDEVHSDDNREDEVMQRLRDERGRVERLNFYHWGRQRLGADEFEHHMNLSDDENEFR